MKKNSTLSFITLGFCALSLSVNAQLINEGFEGTFPPSGWTVDNPDGLETFMQATVGKTGSKSAYIDVYSATGPGQGSTDALITGAVNLSTVTNPTLTFQRAYQMFSDPATPYTPKDSLYVQISVDGGTTWLPLFDKAGVNLITATQQFNAGAGFVPTSSEWAMETVAIPTGQATATSAQFKFSFMNDWENNFYLDDIMVTGGAAVNELSLDAYVNVFPNPSHGNVNVELAAFGLGQTDVVIYNMVGEVIEQVSHNVLSPKRVKIDLANQPNGLYFVKVKTENGSSTKKLTLNK